MGIHHRWVAEAIRGGGEPPGQPGKPGLRGDELIAWLRDGVEDLAELLEASDDDDAPAWSWSGDNRVGFWRRRTALETMVHRWDGENATGVATSLDSILASDGIDEFLGIFVPRYGSAYEGDPATLSLSTTDAPGRWTTRFDTGELPVTEPGDGGTPADVLLDGRAEDLCLFLWGRRGPEAVSAGGDDDLTRAVIGWLSN
jgi:uncharacterized protein (TIGR03083 family)